MKNNTSSLLTSDNARRIIQTFNTLTPKSIIILIPLMVTKINHIIKGQGTVLSSNPSSFSTSVNPNLVQINPDPIYKPQNEFDPYDSFITFGKRSQNAELILVVRTI